MFLSRQRSLEVAENKPSAEPASCFEIEGSGAKLEVIFCSRVKGGFSTGLMSNFDTGQGWPHRAQKGGVISYSCWTDSGRQASVAYGGVALFIRVQQPENRPPCRAACERRARPHLRQGLIRLDERAYSVCHAPGSEMMLADRVFDWLKLLPRFTRRRSIFHAHLCAVPVAQTVGAANQ